MPNDYKFEIDVDTSHDIYDLNISFNSFEELLSFLSQTFIHPTKPSSIKASPSQDFVAFSNYDSSTPRKKRVRDEDIVKTTMTISSLNHDKQMMAKKVNTISTDSSSPVTSKYSNFSELKH